MIHPPSLESERTFAATGNRFEREGCFRGIWKFLSGDENYFGSMACATRILNARNARDVEVCSDIKYKIANTRGQNEKEELGALLR